MNIEIDRSKWSSSSQRSTAAHYDERTLYYEGIAYHCKKCGKPCVFTAEQQKVAHEELKKFVWWRPSLCSSCEQESEGLQAKIKECQIAWNTKKDSLSKDREFLEYWRFLLREIEKYGRKGSHPSNVIMISKLLNNFE
jgi:hypothetical protein